MRGRGDRVSNPPLHLSISCLILLKMGDFWKPSDWCEICQACVRGKGIETRMTYLPIWVSDQVLWRQCIGVCMCVCAMCMPVCVYCVREHVCRCFTDSEEEGGGRGEGERSINIQQKKCSAPAKSYQHPPFKVSTTSLHSPRITVSTHCLLKSHLQ